MSFSEVFAAMIIALIVHDAIILAAGLIYYLIWKRKG